MSEQPLEPHSFEALLSAAKYHETFIGNICEMCLNVIKVQIFKGTGVCGENCRKDRDNDHAPAGATIEAPIGGERV